ncbi:hypothetical protein BaRGS_00034307 [Batillaria attramentaria]|uniref:Secreted protein n=1 Tax=Batillaria attramentaria TaxID=370345 RepID=A0ABD0JHK6_9CAEN
MQPAYPGDVSLARLSRVCPRVFAFLCTCLFRITCFKQGVFDCMSFWKLTDKLTTPVPFSRPPPPSPQCPAFSRPDYACCGGFLEEL